MIDENDIIVEEFRGESATLLNITQRDAYFKVQSNDISTKIKSMAISNYYDNDFLFETISIDDSSEIAEIPSSIIFAGKIIYLSSSIKRIKNVFLTRLRLPTIVCNRNRFISVFGKRNIVIHYPLELSIQFSCRSRLRIRETVVKIESAAFFGLQSITTLIIPSSVQIIDSSSFRNCNNLKNVFFMKNSRLELIGEYAFAETSINKFLIVSAVEVIGSFAFQNCNNLTMINFQENSKLKKVGECVFHGCKYSRSLHSILLSNTKK